MPRTNCWYSWNTSKRNFLRRPSATRRIKNCWKRNCCGAWKRFKAESRSCTAPKNQMQSSRNVLAGNPWLPCTASGFPTRPPKTSGKSSRNTTNRAKKWLDAFLTIPENPCFAPNESPAFSGGFSFRPPGVHCPLSLQRLLRRQRSDAGSRNHRRLSPKT